MSEDVIFGFTVEKNKEDGLNTTNVSDKKEFLNPRHLKSENSWVFNSYSVYFICRLER